VREDAHDDSPIFNGGDDLHAPATVRAVFDGDVKDPLEQTRPTQARRRARRVLCSMIACTVRPRHDRGTQFGSGREITPWDLVAYAWAGFGASFRPTIFLSLYWQGMSRPGTIAGVIVGGITVIVWKQLSGGLFDLYEIVPGVIVSAAAMVIVSKLAPVRAPPAEV